MFKKKSLFQQVLDIVNSDDLLYICAEERKATIAAFSFFYGRNSAIDDLIDGKYIPFFSDTAEAAKIPCNVQYACIVTDYLERLWEESNFPNLLEDKSSNSLSQNKDISVDIVDFVTNALCEDISTITDENVILSVYSFFLGRSFVAADLLSGFSLEVFSEDNGEHRYYGYTLDALNDLQKSWKEITK